MVVLPVPGLPSSRYTRPGARPPARMLSRPSIPVDKRRSLVSVTDDPPLRAPGANPRLQCLTLEIPGAQRRCRGQATALPGLNYDRFDFVPARRSEVPPFI